MPILDDAWVVNLRSNNKGKIMNFFKRKRKRMAGGFCTERKEVSEQEYVDKEFQDLKDKILTVNARIDMLTTLVDKEYILIFNGMSTKINNEYYSADKGRQWAKDNGYSYIKFFEKYGELWVKETKGE